MANVTDREFADLIIRMIRSHYVKRISYSMMARMMDMPMSSFYTRTPNARKFTPWRRQDIAKAAEVFHFSEEEKLELLK